MTAPNTSPAELLMIEDSDDDYAAFIRTCKAINFSGHVRRFLDGEEALAHLRTLSAQSDFAARLPALIVLDLNLPGMDGREILGALKADAKLRTIPVVVYTTSSSPNDIAFCYEQHANAYQLKAMDVDRLEADLRALTDYWFARVMPHGVSDRLSRP
ncbi:MAG TPA: response regulator [Polyangia bacterium]